jgi:CBS domain-containing protein
MTRNARRPRTPNPAAEPPASRVPKLPLAYNVTVADAMSPSPVAVGPGATLFEALLLLRACEVTGFPVVDATGAVIGLLSERDLARELGVPLGPRGTQALLDLLATPEIRELPAADLDGRRALLKQTAVEEAMGRPPIVVDPGAPLELAMEVMDERGIHRLPVVDRDRLVGILTPTDLAGAALSGARRRR